MTNLDQHSALYGTEFGVMGSLEGLFRNASSATLLHINKNDSTDTIAARRLRRRNRQLRMH